jgi:hypothetical protein
MGLESAQSSQNETPSVPTEVLKGQLDGLEQEKSGYEATLADRSTPGDEVITTIFRVAECSAKIEQTRLMLERATLIDEMAVIEEYLSLGAETIGARGDRATSTERMDWVGFVKSEREKIAESKRRIADIDMKLARVTSNSAETSTQGETIV